MGPAYLRELEGVIYRYANPTSTTTTATPDAKAKQEEPPPIAILVSESAFTRNCLLAAHASPLPFLLVHLPQPPSSSSDSSSSSSSGGGAGTGAAIGAVFGNPALVSAKGVLGGELEIRWERAVPSLASLASPSSSSGVLCGSGRPRLWWQGQPLASWTPDADVDADGAVLNQR
jgi:hypothetical protein